VQQALLRDSLSVRRLRDLGGRRMPLGIGKDKLVHINQFSIHGEKGTGYEGPAKGDFNCQNCEYFRKSSETCGQPDFVNKTGRRKTADGKRAYVEALGCCEYVDRIGKFFGGEEKK
jgi:hypothetical protein